MGQCFSLLDSGCFFPLPGERSALPTRAFRFLHLVAELERGGAGPQSGCGDASKERDARFPGARETGR